MKMAELISVVHGMMYSGHGTAVSHFTKQSCFKGHAHCCDGRDLLCEYESVASLLLHSLLKQKCCIIPAPAVQWQIGSSRDAGQWKVSCGSHVHHRTRLLKREMFHSLRS